MIPIRRVGRKMGLKRVRLLRSCKTAWPAHRSRLMRDHMGKKMLVRCLNLVSRALMGVKRRSGWGHFGDTT